MNRLQDYRSEFPVAETTTYLNHAAVSPVPLRTAGAVEALYREFSHEGIARYPDWIDRIGSSRRMAADLLGADPKEIAFVASTSEGVSAVAQSLDWREGDGVLLPRPDFPTNIYPWMHLERRGVRVCFYERREGRFDVNDVERALVPGVRVLAVTSVDFATGFMCDMEALGDLCRRKGLLFFVDAIQSLGAAPLDARRLGIHFLAAGGHKWLLSAMGCGLLFVSREVRDRLVPDRVGWLSVRNEMDFDRLDLDLKPVPACFETGSPNLPGIVALGESIGLLLEGGRGPGPAQSPGSDPALSRRAFRPGSSGHHPRGRRGTVRNPLLRAAGGSRGPVAVHGGESGLGLPSQGRDPARSPPLQQRGGRGQVPPCPGSSAGLIGLQGLYRGLPWERLPAPYSAVSSNSGGSTMCFFTKQRSMTRRMDLRYFSEIPRAGSGEG